MKKLWKYIVGFFTIVLGGILAFLSGKGAGRKAEKFKNINTEIKKIDKSLKKRQKDKNGYNKKNKKMRFKEKEIKKNRHKRYKKLWNKMKDF